MLEYKAPIEDYSQELELHAERARESTAIIDETKKSIKELIEGFGKLPQELGNTKESIDRLKEELNDLTTASKILAVEQNLNVKLQKEINEVQEKANRTKGLNKRQLKKHRSKVTEEEIAVKSKVKEHKDETKESRRTVAYTILSARAEMKALEEERERLEKLIESERKVEDAKKADEEKKKTTTTEPKGEDKESTKSTTTSSKDKGGDEEKQKSRNRRPAWLNLFAKSAFKTIGTTFKVALSPVTLLLRGMTGMVRGIWGSSIMSLAKTGAILAFLVYSFDWLQVIINTWRRDLQNAYKEGFGKDGKWTKAIENIVVLSEQIRSFIDPNYESTFLGKTEVTLLNIVTQMAVTLGNILKETFLNVSASIVAGLMNSLKLGSGHTTDSVRMSWAYRSGDIKDRNITMGNIDDAYRYRTIRGGQLYSEVYNTINEYGEKYDTSELYEERDITNKSAWHIGEYDLHRKRIREAYQELLMRRGLSEEDAKTESLNQDNIKSFVESMITSMDSLKGGIGDDFGEFIKTVRDNPIEAVKKYPALYKQYEDFLDESGLVDREQIKKSLQRSLLGNISDEKYLTMNMGYLLGIDNMEDLTELYREIQREKEEELKAKLQQLEVDDEESKKLIQDMQSGELEYTIMKSKVKISHLMRDEEDMESGSNVVQINNSSNNYSSGITPIGELPLYGGNGSNLSYS